MLWNVISGERESDHTWQFPKSVNLRITGACQGKFGLPASSERWNPQKPCANPALFIIYRGMCHSTPRRLSHIQKNPRVRKIFVRNSGAGNGYANFMGTWKNCVLSAGKPMSIKFRVLGGGILGFGGGSADFIFMGAGVFLTHAHNRFCSGAWGHATDWKRQGGGVPWKWCMFSISC